MESRIPTRVLFSLALVVAAGLGGLLLDADINAVLIALVAGVAAVLLAGGTATPRALPLRRRPPEAPRRDDNAMAHELAEAIVEPILLIVDHRITYANQAARTLFGAHILGEDVRIAIRHPAATERLLGPADAVSGAPIHLVGLGTRDQRWEMRTRVLSDGGRIVHLIDRTGSYATERIRVDFVANASHELRTPLASLLGFIETLTDEAGEDPETRQRFLKVMFAEAVRMQRLVDDLMSLSRIEAEKYREPDQRVDLGELAREAVASICDGQDPRAMDLVIEASEAPPVKGDRAQLSQIIYNIVGNAMKYGRPGTPVTIGIDYDGGSTVRLSVSDVGEGVAPEHLPRLTERFYRVDSGRSRAMGGTGLGLAIVKHIVERHRGRLDIESRVGQGTTVSILLPLAPLSSRRNVIETQAT